jgi:hypothetical protein
MAIELVNIGRIANDGTGDDLREAFTKINRSLEDLDLRIDDKTEGANVGSGIGVFYRRDGYDLQFKSLTTSGNTLTITDNTTSVNIDLASGIGDTPIVTDNGSFNLVRNSTLNIRGNGVVSTTANPLTNTVLVDVTASNLSSDPSPLLNAPLNANNYNIFGVNDLTAQDVKSTIYGIDVRELANGFYNFDFGDFGAVTVTNFVDFLRYTFDLDFGTITSPAGVTVDEGTIV